MQPKIIPLHSAQPRQSKKLDTHRLVEGQFQSCFIHLRPLHWQVSNKATTDTALEFAFLLWGQQQNKRRWSPLSQPYLPCSWPNSEEIISPNFLQEGSKRRKLSTSRGTLQLQFQLLQLSCLWITNHSVDRYILEGWEQCSCYLILRPAIEINLFFYLNVSQGRGQDKRIFPLHTFAGLEYRSIFLLRKEIQSRQDTELVERGNWHCTELQRKGFKDTEWNSSKIFVSECCSVAQYPSGDWWRVVFLKDWCWNWCYLTSL